MRAECAAMSSWLQDRFTRLIDAGRWAKDTPCRHSRAGRIGRGANPPPQFGQTLFNFCATHAAQNVHSKEQINASVAAGGKSLSQYSQFGRSSNAILMPSPSPPR